MAAAGRPAAAVVLASLAAAPDPALGDLLGDGAAASLRDALAARARRWAAAVAPEQAFEATSPMMAGAALRHHDGPLLLAAGDVPALDARLAAAALEDLAAGADVVWAPTTDGTPFLLGFARPDPELLDLVGGGFEAWAGAAATRGGGLGMLRSERRLVTPADARALAADPLAPEELLRHLRGAVAVRRAGVSGR
jgi:hypothetical protein